MILVTLVYALVAVLLHAALRTRWEAWYRRTWPTLAEDGDTAHWWFVGTCALWPLWVPLFLWDSREAVGR